MSAFDNKVVLITGASGNLGSVVAHKFAAEGAKLILAGRSAGELDALAGDLNTEILTIETDVNDPAAVDALIQQAVERFGGIDALVHTVGGYAAGKSVHETDVELLDKMYNLNVRPVYITAGRVAQAMIERGQGGKIVVISAKPALKGGAKNAAYSASKSAVLRIVESMALELREHNINVNAVLPSIIDSPQNRAAMPNADTSKWVTPEQLADVIAFLCSDAAAPINGASIEAFGRT